MRRIHPLHIARNLVKHPLHQIHELLSPGVRRASLQFSGNRRAQQFLERNVAFCQFLLGIGSGEEVDSSGEKAVLELLCCSSPPPYCVFDVGSNAGQYLSLVLNTLPPEGLAVHCFEPSLYTYGLLEASLDGTKKPGVVLNNMALGADPGEMTLYYDKPGSTGASLTRRNHVVGEFLFDQSERVPVDTIDNYCLRNGVDRIDLLKCDVEGHELDVFHGAEGMLQRGSIGMITFEFGPPNIDTRTYLQDFYYYFESLGMRILRVTPSGYLQPIARYDWSLEQFRCSNFVVLRADEGQDAL
jgi:FkbM family methyltransferase